MQYRAKPNTVEAVQYTGQELPGVERQYLGTDEVGQPLYQGVIRFPGGFVTMRQGDWLVDGVVYPPKTFATTFEVVPKEVPVADAPATGDGDAI